MPSVELTIANGDIFEHAKDVYNNKNVSQGINITSLNQYVNVIIEIKYRKENEDS